MLFLILIVICFDKFLHAVSNNETTVQQCIKMKNLLFNNLHSIDKALIEWKTLLPRFMKTELDVVPYKSKKSKTNPTYKNIHHVRDERVRDDNGFVNVELELNSDHQRFHVLGPIGPSCRKEIERYAKGLVYNTKIVSVL